MKPKSVFGICFLVVAGGIFFSALVYSRPFFQDPKIFTASLDNSITYQAKDDPSPKEEHVAPSEPEPVRVAIKTRQDHIDDILEKIDVLRRQIADLEETEIEIEDEILVLAKEDEKLLEIKPETQVAKLASAKTKEVYLRILISEIQLGAKDDAKQEFVELFNPNSQAIDLTDWYVQRKTKTGSSFLTFASSALFEGKTIPPQGYFLIAREGYFFSMADIFINNPLTEDNTLVLKDPNQDIVDKVGWGRVSDASVIPAPNPEDQKSIGRIFEDGSERNFGDNQIDFAVSIPTPKSQNVVYIAPPQEIPAPIIVFSDLAALQNTLSLVVHFDIKAALPIEEYTFRHKEELGEWQEDEHKVIEENTGSFLGAEDFLGQDEKNYYFQIKVKDTLGNESGWLPEIPATTKISLPKKVLISQVQASGIVVGDEFIELYNPNEVDMDLTGYLLTKKASTGTESNLISSGSFSGTIGAGHYFLIAPQKNDDGTEKYSGSVEPDLRYSGKSFSFASNNTILIYNHDGLLLDKVGLGIAEDFENVAASNPPTSKSIVRKDNQDTNDNSQDFVIQDADPKNASYVADVTPLEPEPVIEEPVIEEPVIEEPVIEEPVIEEPVIEEPVIEEPVIDEILPEPELGLEPEPGVLPESPPSDQIPSVDN